MNQDERNAAILAKYIPDKAIPVIVKWIKEFDFKLKLTKVRNSKLGDYRPPIDRPNHQITINHNLNPYAFLVTLVHEIAHLTCYNKFKNNVSPHGSEWKREYCHLMTFFMNDDIFPNDVLFALATHLRTPGASDRKSTRLNSSHSQQSRMPSSA